jgi:hypothetical protein
VDGLNKIIMKRTLLVVIVLGLGIYMAYNHLPFLFVSKERIMKEANCRDEKLAMGDKIIGILSKKYRDEENHMWKTIEYSNQSESFKSIIFLNETSGAFDFILPGDSIFKDLNSLEFKVIREGVVKVYKLNYGCD